MSSGLWPKDRRWYLSFCFFPSRDLRVTSGLDSEIALEGQTRWLHGHEWPACSVLEAEIALSCTISRSDWLETHWTWDEVTSSNHASSPMMVCGTCTPHDLLLPSNIKSPPSRDEGGSRLTTTWFSLQKAAHLVLDYQLLGSSLGKTVSPTLPFLKLVVLCVGLEPRGLSPFTSACLLMSSLFGPENIHTSSMSIHISM